MRYGEFGQHKTERENDVCELMGKCENMSVRLSNILLDAGIKTLLHASEFSRKSFLYIKGCGPGCVNELEKCLRENGLSFAPDVYRQPWKDDGTGIPVQPIEAGTVYFIRSADKVKIGFCLKGGEYRRLKALQTSNYEKLELIALIENSEYKNEKALHKKFTHLRIRGEWFEFNDEIKSFIKEEAVLV